MYIKKTIVQELLFITSLQFLKTFTGATSITLLSLLTWNKSTTAYQAIWLRLRRPHNPCWPVLPRLTSLQHGTAAWGWRDDYAAITSASDDELRYVFSCTFSCTVQASDRPSAMIPCRRNRPSRHTITFLLTHSCELCRWDSGRRLMTSTNVCRVQSMRRQRRPWWLVLGHRRPTVGRQWWIIISSTAICDPACQLAIRAIFRRGELNTLVDLAKDGYRAEVSYCCCPGF